MRAALLALLLLAAPTVAVAAHDDVAWLASALGVPASELPASVAATRTQLAPGLVSTQTIEMPIADLAALAVAAGATTDAVAPPGAPSYAGAGLRDATRWGVIWTGFALGDPAMACMSPSSPAPSLALPPNPALQGPTTWVALEVALPDALVASKQASVSMQTRALPSPVTTYSTLTGVNSGTFAILSGEIFTACRIVFNQLLTVAQVRGDGTVHGS